MTRQRDTSSNRSARPPNIDINESRGAPLECRLLDHGRRHLNFKELRSPSSATPATVTYSMRSRCRVPLSFAAKFNVDLPRTRSPRRCIRAIVANFRNASLRFARDLPRREIKRSVVREARFPDNRTWTFAPSPRIGPFVHV